MHSFLDNNPSVAALAQIPKGTGNKLANEIEMVPINQQRFTIMRYIGGR